MSLKFILKDKDIVVDKVTKDKVFTLEITNSGSKVITLYKLSTVTPELKLRLTVESLPVDSLLIKKELIPSESYTLYIETSSPETVRETIYVGLKMEYTYEHQY